MNTLVFRATHDYNASIVGIEIPIRLRSGDSEIRLHAKVDTGATYCIFQREYADALGIEVESGMPMPVATVTGSFVAFGHQVRISCLNWEFDAVVYFAGSPGFPRNVVGQTGWLEHFRLGIVHSESLLYLSRYDD